MLNDDFAADLRTVVHAQAHLLRRLDERMSAVERSFAENRMEAPELAEMERLLDALEANVHLLKQEDLADFDPDEIPRLYDERRAAVVRDLARFSANDWNSLVCQSRVYAFQQDLDPLAPYEGLLTPADFDQMKRESYEAQLRWDKWDYMFVFGSGILAALTDYFLVRIPKSLSSGVYAGQQGSPLTEWLQGYDIHNRDDFFARWAQGLEKTCQTPYDRQEAVFGDVLSRIPGMGGTTHRFQSLGHDPVLGFIFGVLDIMRGTISGFSYEHLAGKHTFIEGQIYSPLEPIGFLEALLKHLGHLVSDVATKMGLPAPFITLLQAFDIGSFGDKGRTVGQLARWMYLNGYDFRHFLVSGITPAVIEIVLRGYLMIRHYAEHGETKFLLASNPKYRSMLLTAHGVAAAANAGKVWLYSGNPLAINQAEWMAFLRYLLPHMKYWLFDRHRLRLEHMDRINDAGWDELVTSSSRLMNRVVVDTWPVVRLGEIPTSVSPN